MIILGINAFHGDSAAALVRDGKLIAAAEEERFRRTKHWAGFPAQSIRWCLESSGLKISDIDAVAVNQDSRAQIWRKISYVLRQKMSHSQIADRIRNRSNRHSMLSLFSNEFTDELIKAKLVAVEHHAAHLSSAFHVSPFNESAVASIDGFGDFSSAAWGIGKNNDITIQSRVFYPHSLGVFYQALTQFIGFPNYGDEYKVMGLAPYGHPTYLDAMRNVVSCDAKGQYRLNLRYFRHHKEKVDYQWNGGSPHVGTLFAPELEELLGPKRQPADALEQRHKDIARSVQARYEEIFFTILNDLHKQSGLKNICLAGGCAMNSVANGKIRRFTPFEKVYVQSAAGDAGGAIGAAFAHHIGMGGQRTFVMDHAYWGPAFSQEEVASLVAKREADLTAANCKPEIIADTNLLVQRTARAVADGKVVGWFQGRMEWGPRALGNRSILGDPRRADMKDILNAKIKRRESFRPFAPSVLSEKVGEWFEEDDAVPFMMQVFQIREARRKQIPAVCHVDGSGRLQTVTTASNPRYHALIAEFNRQTGIPMVLNTSFNENEPVVCRPDEALDCFLRTRMDVIVLGDCFIERQEGSPESLAESTDLARV